MVDPMRDASKNMAITSRQRAAAVGRITAELAALGPTLPGTITRRATRCGRSNCRCHADPPQLHGPYWWWTRSVNGKTVTKMLTDELYATYRTMFDNHRRTRELLTQLDNLGLALLDADRRYHQRRTRGPTRPTQPVDNPRPPNR